MKAGDLGCLWIVVGPTAAVLLITGAAIAACVTVLVIAAVLVAASAVGIALLPPLLAALTLTVLGVVLRGAARGPSRVREFVESTTQWALSAAGNPFAMPRQSRGIRLTSPNAVLRPVRIAV